jgi:quinol monooxygenase YgiN
VKPFSRVRENELLFYQIKIAIKQYKADEFVDHLGALSRKIRKEKGCLGYSVYRDSEKENTYSVVGEWKTRQAMEKHFKTQDFDILIGAARVLGETFEMNIADVLKTGDFELAEQMASQKRGNAVAD